MLKKSEFAKNSFILILGTGLAQLIPIALQPIVRRIFTDEEFGLFAQYYSIVAILSIVAGLKYESAIVIPEDDKKAVRILAGSILLNLFSSLILFIVLLFLGRQIFTFFGFSLDLLEYVWLFPISVFLIATNVAFNFWLTRKKKFKGLVYNKAVRRGSEGIGRIGLGYALKSGGLFLGTLVGDFFNFLMFLFQFKRSGGAFKGLKKNEINEALSEQSEFPKYALFPAVLNVVSTHLPVFLLSALFSKSIVGQYDGSREILAVPLALISLSISQVLYQKIVEDDRAQKPILKLMKSNALFLIVLACIGIIIFYPFGEPIFKFVFGDNWALAGRLSSILVFSYAIRFIVSPLSIIFIALKKLKIAAVWQIGYFILMLNLLWLQNVSIEEFILYFVLIDVFAYLIYGILIYITAKNQEPVQLDS